MLGARQYLGYRCREGGVLTRPGHTEAAVDLARLAGCQPAGVLLNHSAAVIAMGLVVVLLS